MLLKHTLLVIYRGCIVPSHEQKVYLRTIETEYENHGFGRIALK